MKNSIIGVIWSSEEGKYKWLRKNEYVINLPGATTDSAENMRYTNLSQNRRKLELEEIKLIGLKVLTVIMMGWM